MLQPGIEVGQDDHGVDLAHRLVRGVKKGMGGVRQDGGALIETVDQMEQELASSLSKRQIAEFARDNEVEPIDETDAERVIPLMSACKFGVKSRAWESVVFGDIGICQDLPGRRRLNKDSQRIMPIAYISIGPVSADPSKATLRPSQSDSYNSLELKLPNTEEEPAKTSSDIFRRLSLRHANGGRLRLS